MCASLQQPSLCFTWVGACEHADKVSHIASEWEVKFMEGSFLSLLWAVLGALWQMRRWLGIHPNPGAISITVLTPLLLAPHFIALNCLFVCIGPYLGSTFPPFCLVSPLPPSPVCLPVFGPPFVQFHTSSRALYLSLCLCLLQVGHSCPSVFYSLSKEQALAINHHLRPELFNLPPPHTCAKRSSGRTKWWQGLKIFWTSILQPDFFFFFLNRVSKIWHLAHRVNLGHTLQEISLGL